MHTRCLTTVDRYTDEHSVDEFRDTTSTAHHELVEIVQRLARAPRLKV
jgi:hypothetical protein